MNLKSKIQYTPKPNETVLLSLSPNGAVVTHWLIRHVGHFLAVWFLALVIFEGGTVSFQGNPKFGASLVTLVAVVISGVWVNFIRQRHQYIVTNQRCILYFGFLMVQKQMIPHSSIVECVTEQSVIDRLLGLSTTKLHIPTFGSRANKNSPGEIALFGLTPEESDQIVSALAK